MGRIGRAHGDLVAPRRAMTRSEVMARVHSKDTTPELTVRRALHAAGFRFRLHRKSLPGCPDLVFVRQAVAVFVNGCFWHGHRCEDGKRPASNTDYWNSKITRNMARDKRNVKTLRRMGWTPAVIWTCQLERGISRLLVLLRRLQESQPEQAQ
jgi:DNA mismatch endonuclease (patch repair protein)